MPNSIAPLGPVCSSWVFLSRYSSKRNYLRPEGLTELPWVVQANTMAARVCLILLLVVFAESTFLLEQPVSSLLPRYQRFRQVISSLRHINISVYQQLINLGAFGSDTKKPVFIWSNNRKLLRKLWRPILPSDKLRFLHKCQQKQLVKRSISKSGKKQVTGIPSALRKSQSGAYVQLKTHGFVDLSLIGLI